MKLQLATLLLTVLLSNTTALPSVDHCLTRFEDSLKETILLKKTCDEANLRDCCQIAQASEIINNEGYSPESGIYDISNVCQYTAPFTQDIFPSMQARCNMDSGDGGWTVLMRRTPDVAKRELFNRTWEEYENGFGNLTGEFWYGLKNMHCLTSREPMEVEVEVSKTDGAKLVLPYGEFKVDGPDTKYTVHVSDKEHEEPYDYLGSHDGMKFSTFDSDNDLHASSCSLDLHGKVGWWFHSCDRTQLTHMPHPELYTTVDVTYHYAELRVRAKSCSLLEPPKKCEK